MNKRAILAGLFATLAFSLPLSLPADNHEQPKPLTDVWYVIPKRGMEAEFESAVKAHNRYRVDQGEAREWSIYVPVVGHNLRVYQFRSCCHDFADLDKFESEDGKQGLTRHWNENVDQYVDHYHHYLERNDWKHSHMLEDGGPFKYYGVTSWVWKEDAGPASGIARRHFSKIAKEQGWASEDHQWLWLSRIGGKAVLMLVNPMENYADMAPTDPSFYDFLAEKLGSETAADAVFADFNSGFASSDYTIWTEREDLTPDDD
jgi:hypothetical protein